MPEKAVEKPNLNLFILPLDIEIENCIASILEVHKYDFPWGTRYIVACSVRCGDAVSNVFNIVYSNGSELAKKLTVEVTKFKYLLWLYGKEKLKAMGIARI